MRADFYGRKSNKGNGRSVPGQEQEFRKDCEAQEFDVGRIFVDPDRSASRYAKRPRPDFVELLEHIRAGNCEVLSLWESSRGSRELGEWVEFLDLCEEKRVLIRVISHGRTYDVSNRRDWRTLIEDGVDSDNEARVISERTKRGKLSAATDGRPTSRLAYGFKRVYDERGHFVEQIPHPEQAPIVREIFRRVAEGEPFHLIATSLNERGLPSPEGKQWSDRQVRTTASRDSYVGDRVHQGKVIGKGQWEALVDRKTWQAAEARLKASGSRLHNDSRLSHWLTGAVKCGLCQHTLRSSTRADGTKAYECRSCHKVSASARGLESTVEAMLLARLRQPDAALLFTPADNTELVDQLIEEKRVLAEHLQGYYKQAARPGARLSPAGLAAIEEEILPQLDDLEAKIRRASTPPTLSVLEGIDVAEEWGGLETRIRREVVCALTDLVLMPAGKPTGPRFDRSRLSKSRWVGDDKTWGDYWRGMST